MKKIIATILLLSLLALNVCVAAGINDAAKNEAAPITIKSELERANREGFKAEMRGMGGDIKAFDEQLSSLVTENYKNGTGTVPYFCGINAMFWQNAVSELKGKAFDSDLAKQYFSEFRKRQKDLNIDNKTLFSFFHFNDEYYSGSLEPMLNKWIDVFENK